MELHNIEAAAESRAAFTVEAKPLAAAVAFLAKRVIEPRNSIPILSHVMIAADPAGHVTLTGTDKDMFAAVTIAADVEAPGTFCTDAANLSAMLAKLAKASALVRLSDAGEGRADLKAGRNAFKLKTLPADDFPHPAGGIEPSADAWASDGARMVADLAALSPVMGEDSQRYYLNGVQFERRDMAGRDCLVMVATNGHGMAISSRPAPDGMADMPGAILPTKAARLLVQAAKLAGESAPLSWEYDAGRFRFRLGNVALQAKAIDGDFPQWWRAWEGMGTGGDESPCLFPELLPGAPVAMLEKLGKAAPCPLSWEYRGDRYIGTAPGDDGLVFLAMAMANGGCGKKGFEYSFTGHGEAQAYLLSLAEARGLPLPGELEARAAAINEGYGETVSGNRPSGKAEADSRLIVRGDKVMGLTVSGTHRFNTWREIVQDWEALVEREVWHHGGEEPIEGSYSILMPAEGPAQLASESEIIGPDGVAYPVAMSDRAIHMSKEQVRALVGDSCFETMAVTLPDGSEGYILAWLWRDGASRFLTVRKDGRTFAGGRYVTRAEIEAGPVIEAAAEAEPEAEAAPMPEISATAGAESESEGGVAHDMAEAPEALHGPEIAPDELASDDYRLPAPDVGPSQAERLADLLGRAQAMAAELIALAGGLSAESEAPTDATAAAPPIAEIRPKRTPAHERAIRRAWAERARRREAERCRDSLRQDCHEWEALQHRTWSEAMAHKVKRRQAVMQALSARKARKMQRQRADGWKSAHDRVKAELSATRDRNGDLAAALDNERKQAAQALEKARMAASYIDGEGREGPDMVARTAHHARLAIDKADALSGELAQARDALARQGEAIAMLGREIEAATLRAVKAETALAAVQARANGWPPAVRPATVKVAFAA